MTKRGILTVVSGFSGSGKGTIMKQLVGNYTNYALSISATTRTPREAEIDGKDYFFMTREDFQSMIVKDDLIEFAEYVGNYYGTPKSYVEDQLSLGKDVILEIEIQGALKIKKKFPNTLLLFIAPPTGSELIRRLTDRGTEDIATIRYRMCRAVEEAEGVNNYDYFVINDILEDCVEKIHTIIQNEHNRVYYNMHLIENITEELKDFSEGE